VQLFLLGSLQFFDHFAVLINVCAFHKSNNTSSSSISCISR
jgi:hypothetical protein